MKLVTIQDLAQIVKKHGFENFMGDLVTYLKNDFVR